MSKRKLESDTSCAESACAPRPILSVTKASLLASDAALKEKLLNISDSDPDKACKLHKNLENGQAHALTRISSEARSRLQKRQNTASEKDFSR